MGNKLWTWTLGLLTFILTLYLCESHSHDHHAHQHGHAHHHHGHAHNHNGHGHSHDEPPSFKYSKRANTQPEHDPHEHAHEHAHHGHAHEHAHHGHAHHGHAHEHAHHGHAHEHAHHGHAHEHAHHGHEPPHAAAKNDHVYDIQGIQIRISPRQMIWIRALVSTLLISLAPYCILYFIPIQSNSEESKPFLNVLLAFASGGLLGDAFLHLIPHAVSPHAHGGDDGGESHAQAHSHSHGHSHEHGHDLGVGLWVLAGILTFLCVEKFVRIVKGGGHGHSHGGGVGKVEADKKEAKKENKKDKKNGDEKKDDKGDGKERDVKVVEPAKGPGEIRVAGLLNLAADFTHNFTDGLAVGASYLAGNSLGVITTITILLHEVPHEIGDFAILVQSGYEKSKAMKLQLVTALGAFAGTIIGLLSEGDSASGSWILPFTAGGFVYIATVSVIPELLEGKPSLKQTLMEITAMLIGIGLMILIAFYE